MAAVPEESPRERIEHRRILYRRRGLSVKRHRVEPWTYLRELLLRLHDDDLRHDEMLSDQWVAHHPKAVLTDRLKESRRKAATRNTRRRHDRATSPKA